MEVTHAICRVSIAPLRSEASDRAEIVSQLLFGDYVQVLQKTEKWFRVQTAFDEYQGWVDFKQLAVISEAEYQMASTDYLVPAAVHSTLKAADGTNYYLATGSSLPLFSDGNCYLGKERFEVNFLPAKVNYTRPEGDILQQALFFLNAPYLWGGRTLFGIDCSGLVQIVFKMAGIKLKRDASQQALEGTTVDFLAAAQPGDVAFFDNDEGRITHVGILLSNKEIIHASGKVRIDPIDDQGIFNKELKRYTHNLRIIKRFL
ncbi:MAG: hydrolase [Pedobacter sp.]|jgi:cell wall-associated NlpC family hydrolase|nr:hydrolase [Pedobacter sp.]